MANIHLVVMARGALCASFLAEGQLCDDASPIEARAAVQTVLRREAR